MENIIDDFYDRSLKALDVCNAVRDGIEQLMQWQKLLEIVFDSLNNGGGGRRRSSDSSLGEGHLRRSKRALDDLSVGLSEEKSSNSSSSSQSTRFQEIVPLNSGNVLGTEDNGPAKKWLTLIRRTLDTLPGCTSGGEGGYHSPSLIPGPNSDFEAKFEGSTRPIASSSNNPQTIHEHERIIWLGDLNYRVALSYRSAKALVELQNWRALLENDQVKVEQSQGHVFSGWNEGMIYFPPTYKYLNNSDRYTGEGWHPKEKQRTPAWLPNT